MTVTSAFAKYEGKAWPYRYEGEMHISRICGGIPTNPRVIEGWLKKKLGADNDAILQAQVAEVMLERGVGADDAASNVAEHLNLNGFKRDEERGLYIESRQLKAAIKEAASVAAATGKLPIKKWGVTGKWLNAFVAEHVCVVEDRLYLGMDKPTDIAQRFVQTRHGAGIQYEEYCDDVKLQFTIMTDHEFSEEQWAMIWLTGGQQGIGATRSQGYGRYTVTRWEPATEGGGR